jgi:hypothetical protein
MIRSFMVGCRRVAVLWTDWRQRLDLRLALDLGKPDPDTLMLSNPGGSPLHRTTLRGIGVEHVGLQAVPGHLVVSTTPEKAELFYGRGTYEPSRFFACLEIRWQFGVTRSTTARSQCVRGDRGKAQAVGRRIPERPVRCWHDVLLLGPRSPRRTAKNVAMVCECEGEVTYQDQAHETLAALLEAVLQLGRRTSIRETR